MDTVRILLLAPSTGAGHFRVAQTVAQALVFQGNGYVKPVIMDPFQGKRLPSRMTRLYGPLIVHAPWLWGILYHLSDNGRLVKRWVDVLALLLEGSMVDLLKETQPHLILSVHPLCHSVALRAIRTLGKPIPVAVLITDLQDIHSVWYHPEAALFIAPTLKSLQQLMAWGCPAEKAHPLGVPVDRRFRDILQGQWQIREGLGLEPGRHTVLITGGGEGAGPIGEAVNIVAEVSPDSQVIAVCGRNRTLRRRLQGNGSKHRWILGFVNDMARWMQACDIVVAKAGAVTVAEAVAARRPLVIMSALPGQEKGNLRFVLRAGIGTFAPPRRALVRVLADLMGKDSPTSLWTKNMDQVDRPQAPAHIAGLLLGMVTNGR